jgi:hypothetical protein
MTLRVVIFMSWHVGLATPSEVGLATPSEMS